MNELLVKSYLDSKLNSWAHTTQLSEGRRLRKVAPLITGDPEVLWKGIQHQSPYTRVTTWTRVVAFYQYTFPGKENPYETFRQKNQNYFKGTYQTKRLEITYEEAWNRIEDIGCDQSKRLARRMLAGGTRFCESQQPDGRGYITGKGGKKRPDFRPSEPVGEHGLLHGSRDGENVSPPLVSYVRFYRALRAVGLRPHSLRKLAASRASRNGAKAEDLCEIFGWESFETARRYLQPESTEKLKKFLE